MCGSKRAWTAGEVLEEVGEGARPTELSFSTTMWLERDGADPLARKQAHVSLEVKEAKSQVMAGGSIMNQTMVPQFNNRGDIRTARGERKKERKINPRNQAVPVAQQFSAAFGPGLDPGVPGSSPTLGSSMEPASPSACVSASLSL